MNDSDIEYKLTQALLVSKAQGGPDSIRLRQTVMPKV